MRESWIKTNLQHIGQVFLGNTPAKKDYISYGKYKVIKFRDLKIGYIDFENSKNGFVNPESKKFSSFRELKKNDVLITSAAHSGENIGKKSAFVNKLPTKYEKIFFTGELLNTRIDNNFINPKYIYYYFLSKEGFTEIQKAVKGVHLTSGRAKLINIPLFPLNEQNRIVAKLEKILPKLEEIQVRLDKVPGILERFCQSVLSLACTGRLTEEWREKNQDLKVELLEAWDDDLNGFKTRDLGSIPETWSWVPLGRFAKCERGRFSIRPRNDPNYYGGKYPFIQIGDLPKNGGIISRHTQTLNKKGLSVSKMFPKDTVVIAIVGATIGNTGILSYDMCFPDSLVGINTPTLDGNKFLEYYLRTEREKIRAASYSSGGQPNIKLTTLNPYPFPLPPAEEQKEIVRRVDSLLQLVDQFRARYKKTRGLIDKIQQSFLAKAFRGELALQDPNDEHASKLLERIRQGREAREQQTRTIKNRKVKKPQKEVIVSFPPDINKSDLVTILKEKGPISPNELFMLSEYEIETIEDFFQTLKKGVESKQIAEKRPDNDTILLQLKTS